MDDRLSQQQLRVLQVIEKNQGCTSSQIAWLFIGGVVRDDQMVGSVTIQPDMLVVSKNVSARLSDLVKMQKVERRAGRYHTSYPTRPAYTPPPTQPQPIQAPSNYTEETQERFAYLKSLCSEKT